MDDLGAHQNPAAPRWDEKVEVELTSLRATTADVANRLNWLTEQYEHVIQVNGKLNDALDGCKAEIESLRSHVEFLRDRKTSSSNEVKGADPPYFEGNPRELDAWILACRLKFSLQPSKFGSEDRKVLYGTGFLKGPPKAWINPLASKYLMDQTGVPEFESFDTFVKALKTLYGDPNLERNSMNALKSLKQTSSVAEYISRFIGYSQHTKLNDVGLREYFYDGLKDSIKDELATRSCPTLQSLQETATLLDARLHERRVERERSQGTRRNADGQSTSQGTRLPPSKPPPSSIPAWQTPRPASSTHPSSRPPPGPAVTRSTSAPAAPTTDGSTPMELDSQRLGRLTLQEKDRCEKEERCYRCRQQGHIARLCPRFTVAGLEIELDLAEKDEGQE